jgi:hypothetical protein
VREDVAAVRDRQGELDVLLDEHDTAAALTRKIIYLVSKFASIVKK